MRRVGMLLAVVTSVALVLALGGCSGGGGSAGPSADTAAKPPAPFDNPAMVFHRAFGMGLKYCITLGRWGTTGAFETLAITDPGKGDDAHAAWNPVSPTRLAFLRGGTGTDGIYTVNTDGTSLVRQYPADGSYPPSEYLCWFPEGDRLLFVSGLRAVVIDLLKQANDPLRVQALDLSPWTNDGAEGVKGVSLRRATAGDPGWLLAFAGAYYLYGPDGQLTGHHDADLWVTKLTETADRTVRIAWDGQEGRPSPCKWDAPQWQVSPCWDRTGTSLAFAQASGSSIFGVGWMAATEAEGGVILADSRLCSSGWGDHPSWSPDGAWLCYEGQGYEIFRVRCDAIGAPGEDLTNSPKARDCAPDWNPGWVAP